MKRRTKITWVGDDFILFANIRWEMHSNDGSLDEQNIEVEEGFIVSFHNEVNFDYIDSNVKKLENNTRSDTAFA
jgi:hypothetical protein